MTILPITPLVRRFWREFLSNLLIPGIGSGRGYYTRQPISRFFSTVARHTIKTSLARP